MLKPVKIEFRKGNKNFNFFGDKTHLEVTTVALLATHHDPHGAPLGDEHGFDHSRHFVDESDRPGDVVEDLHIADLLPGHWHVLEQFDHRVGHVLEGAQVDTLVVAVLARCHVPVVADDLPDMF